MKGSMLCETGVSATGIYIGLNGTWFPIPGPSLRGLGSGTGPSDPAELLARHPLKEMMLINNYFKTDILSYYLNGLSTIFTLNTRTLQNLLNS